MFCMITVLSNPSFLWRSQLKSMFWLPIPLLLARLAQGRPGRSQERFQEGLGSTWTVPRAPYIIQTPKQPHSGHYVKQHPRNNFKTCKIPGRQTTEKTPVHLLFGSGCFSLVTYREQASSYREISTFDKTPWRKTKIVFSQSCSGSFLGCFGSFQASKNVISNVKKTFFFSAEQVRLFFCARSSGTL